MEKKKGFMKQGLSHGKEKGFHEAETEPGKRKKDSMKQRLSHGKEKKNFTKQRLSHGKEKRIP